LTLSSPSWTAALASSPTTGQTTGFEPDARHSGGAGLLLFDLDDTIVQGGSYVSPRVMAALTAARDAGYVLAVASGRPYCIVDRTVLKSGVMDYCVCANGAEVVTAREGTSLLRCPMTLEDALDCYDILRPFKPAWNAFFGGNAYFELKGASYMLTGRTGAVARAINGETSPVSPPRKIAKIARRGFNFALRLFTNRRHKQVVRLLPHLRRAADGVEKMGCSIPNANKCIQAERVLGEDGRFEVIRMGTTELEITAHGVTKGTGARMLMDYLGIDATHTVAFGDGANDLPLLTAVGRFVAMGNSDEEVKEQATDVCASVSEDGVALWIENMLSRGGLDSLS